MTSAVSQEQAAALPRLTATSPEEPHPPTPPIFQGLPKARYGVLPEPGTPAHQGCFLVAFPQLLEGPWEHSEDFLLSASSCTRWMLAKRLKIHRCHIRVIQANIISCMCPQAPKHHALFSSQDTFSSSINDFSDKGEGVSCVSAAT